MVCMTRIEWIQLASGKFEAVPAELPEVPEFLKLDPNCFGVVAGTKYQLSANDAARIKKAEPDTELTEGSEIEGGTFWISSKPRRKKSKNTAKKIKSYPDSLTLKNAGKPCVMGENSGDMEADPKRIAALAEYYASQKSIDEYGNETWNGESPFSCDMAEALLREIRGNVELCNYFAEYKLSEGEAA